MSKSMFAIAGLGVGSCLLLSMMMKHLIEVKKDRTRSPVVAELEELLSGKLAGEVKVDVHAEAAGDRTMLVHLPVIVGLPRAKIAATAGEAVWRRLAGQKDEPTRVRVVLEDEDGPGDTLEVPRPGYLAIGATAASPQPPAPAPSANGPTPTPAPAPKAAPGSDRH